MLKFSNNKAKTGQKITTNDLISFIEINKKTINSLGSIHLDIDDNLNTSGTGTMPNLNSNPDPSPSPSPMTLNPNPVSSPSPNPSPNPSQSQTQTQTQTPPETKPKTKKTKQILIINDQSTLKPLQFQDINQITFLPNLTQSFFIPNGEYYRSGVLEKCNPKSDENVSFYSSVIYCLKPTFLSELVDNQIMFIKDFIARLISDYKTCFTKFEYRYLNYTKNNFTTNINFTNPNNHVIKYVADFFHINIFIADIQSDKLYLSNGIKLCPYKKTIFLLKHSNGIYEPVFTKNTKIFTIGNPEQAQDQDKSQPQPNPIPIIIKSLDNITPYIFSDSDLTNKIIIEEEPLAKYMVKKSKPRTKTYVKS